MKTSSPHTLALALGIALAAGPAFADSSASATLGNVHISLTDLDLSDGITPALAINFGSQPYLNGAIGSYGTEFLRDGYAHLGANASSIVTDSVQAAFATSSATMVGADTLAGITSMVVSGTAGSSSVGFGEFGALAANYTSASFTLSAHTSITITVDAAMFAQTTFGYDPVTGAAESASGHVMMVFDGYDADGNSLYDDAYQELAVDAALDANGNVTGAQQSWSGTLSVTFSNASSQDVLGTFYSELGVGGSSIPAPVPEPASYALLMAGLGAIAWVARRRAGASRA